MPDPYPPLYLAIAIEAVIRAGAVQLSRFGTDIRVDKKGAIDLVTEIDLQIEREFRATIAARFPDHVVLGEEFGSSGDREGTPRFCWVFDPVDGTTNYAHGLPIFCSSLALEIDGRPEAAAIYDPTRRELFTAERGEGAYLNGSRLRVSATSELIDALLVTGFPYDVHQQTADLVGLFGAFLGQARAVRRLGSAALDLCYVAAGRFDAFWEQHLKPWDVAGGALVVAEAGGRITGMDGSPFDAVAAHLVASNGQVHDALLNVIRTFRAERARQRTD